MPAEVDLEQEDGPDRTALAARQIAAVVQELNYATLPAAGASGLESTVDVDSVLGSLHAAAVGLEQLLAQLRACLRHDVGAGRLEMNPSRDPTAAVAMACVDLIRAEDAVAQFRSRIGHARGHTAGMSLRPIAGEEPKSEATPPS